jgi:serine protease Do
MDSFVAPPNGAPLSFADLATAANPSVVYVRTVQSQRQGFRRVLRPGTGSGFIFDPAGKILTNYHVVNGAEAIQVELQDGRALMAEIVGADPLTDLAVIHVQVTGLPALALGDSDEIRVGDWVVAIGNPFGLEHTVSAGIISAKERTGRDVQLGDPDAYYSFLQTDASINPGNSGGPLIDLSGRVVGINTAINQTANNIGFAIPVNMVRQLLPRLLKDGLVRRAAIGVQVADISLDDLERLKLPNRLGAFVAQVVPRSPAQSAGVSSGDVIIEFNGKKVRSPEDLRWYASLSPIGEDVPLEVLRGGKAVKLTIRPAPLRLR